MPIGSPILPSCIHSLGQRFSSHSGGMEYSVSFNPDITPVSSAYTICTWRSSMPNNLLGGAFPGKDWANRTSLTPISMQGTQCACDRTWRVEGRRGRGVLFNYTPGAQLESVCRIKCRRALQQGDVHSTDLLPPALFLSQRQIVSNSLQTKRNTLWMNIPLEEDY